MGEYVSITARDGSGTFNAYLSRPAQGSGPGMVVIQEIFGINEYVRRTADRFAEEGYVVLAPDLFWRIEPGIDLGYTPQDYQRAFELFGAFDVDKGIDDIAATIDALRARDDQVGGVGCVGFCLGGKLAYLTAARTDVDCAVGLLRRRASMRTPTKRQRCTCRWCFTWPSSMATRRSNNARR